MESRPQSPAEAFDLLLAGNKRFIAGERLHPHQDTDARNALAPAQFPFAVLFGCSDSRLAAEIIFDRGLGDLFVVRTAGHVVGAEVLGSIEYGVEVLGAPLIAVLGHDSCGAVAAALDTMRGGAAPTGYMRDVVERVMMSVITAEDGLTNPDSAGEEHLRYTARLLVERSAAVAKRVADGTLGVVGLSYALSEGSVQILARHGV